MAKPAGGPKAPKQQGHWDKDEWNEEPEKFDTHHWSETPELGQVPYFFVCLTTCVGVLDGTAWTHLLFCLHPFHNLNWHKTVFMKNTALDYSFILALYKKEGLY